MIIKFLGTSACWPLPRLGCLCPICTSGDPRDKRTRSSILVNNSTLIDCGPDFYHQLSSFPASNFPLLTSIIITHAHFDHIFGLFDAGKIYNGKKVTIYATRPTMQVIQDSFGLHLSNFKLCWVKENFPFEVDKMKVTLFPVEHGITPTFGVKIKADKLLAYIPDFNRILPSNKKLIKDVNVLILDGSSLSTIGKAHGHLSIKEGIELAKSLKAKKVYFTHLGHKTGKHQDLENFIKEKENGNFYIGYDTLEVEV